MGVRAGLVSGVPLDRLATIKSRGSSATRPASPIQAAPEQKAERLLTGEPAAERPGAARATDSARAAVGLFPKDSAGGSGVQPGALEAGEPDR
jgi:hypothetical protein